MQTMYNKNGKLLKMRAITIYSIAAILLLQPFAAIQALPSTQDATSAQSDSRPLTTDSLYVVSLNPDIQDNPDNPEKGKTRPKVGLTLAGGGAKGSAHIGVLKVLDEVGIPIDYVAGTSMGSIIGALYALGYSPEQMDTLISGMDWSVYMSDKVPRREQSYEDKINKSTYMLTIPFNTPKSFKDKVSKMKEENTETRLEREKVKGEGSKKFISSLPGGFIGGNNLLNLFNSLCVGYQDSIDFNDLPIPYACVAVDVVEGKQAVLRSGKLPVAIRASMAIPGVFAPVRMDDKVLVDGGMMNNFPTNVCKRMGADIIIGVEVNTSQKKTADDIKSLPEMLNKLVTIVTTTTTQQNRMLCDIYINPNLEGYGTMSFDKASIDTMIQRGYNAADSQRKYLVELKERLESYGQPVKKVLHAPTATNLAKDSLLISSIVMNGLHEKDAKWLLGKTKLKEGQKNAGTVIESAISQFYGTKAFSAITYQLHKDPLKEGWYQLSFNFTDAEPNTFGLGFRFDSEETAAILLKVGINEQKLRGVKFIASGRLSYNPWGNATFTVVPRKFPRFSLSYNFWKSEATFFDNGTKYSNMKYNKHTVEAFFSETYSRSINASLGVRYDGMLFNHVFNVKAFRETPDSLSDNNIGAFVKFNFDNMNKAYFATRGVRFNFLGDYMFYDLDNHKKEDFGALQFNFQSYIPFFKERFVIIPQLYTRFRYGRMSERPMAYENMMGGSYPGRFFSQQMPFIGVNHPEFLYDNALILRSDFRVNLTGKHYLSGLVNYCRESEHFEGFFSATKNNVDNIGYNWWGVALEYAYESIIGPISLNVHWSNITHTTGLYFNLGFYF